MQYLKLFHRLILRPLRHDPLRTALSVLAVALGVAAVLAIELAGDAAAGSFHSSMEALAGSDLEVTATGGVPADVLTRLARLPYNLKLRPRIEDYALISGERRHIVPLLGVDMLSESLSGSNSGENFSPRDTRVFQQDGSIWVGAGLGYKPGARLRLLINDRLLDYTVQGVLGSMSTELIVMDLAPAARALSRGATLDRILIEVPVDRQIDEWEKLLRSVLPAGVRIAREGAYSDENRRMLTAFRWNLRVLSYIALTVGAFLIYNTISVSVVRRRFEIGILRALGAGRGAVLGAFLGEAAAIGFVGSIVGLLLGRAMAEGAVKMVAVTVNALYVSSRPGSISLTWKTLVLALAMGVGVALLSALSPAREASMVAPIDAMARGRREYAVRVQRWKTMALAFLLAASAWIASRQQPVAGKPLFGYLCAFLLIGACAFAVPALVSGFAGATAAFMRRIFGVEALIATRSLAGSLRRTSVLVAALATAIAMVTAVGVMVGSFRQTVFLWMQDRMQADLYLQPALPGGVDRHPTLSAQIPGLLAQLPEVAAIDPFRGYEIDYEGMPATLGGADARIRGRYGRRPFLSGTEPGAVFAQLIGSNTVVVSEPFANKHHIRSGDVLTLPIGGKSASFRVADVYYDYSSERGFIVMDRGTLLKYLPDQQSSNIAVYLKPGVSLNQGRRAVEAALGGRRALVLSSRNLRDGAMRVFDRTFAITYALEAVAVFVAIMGVSGALLALVIDRRREFGLLRYLGGASNQVRRLILFEAGLLGLLANLAGLILGFVLSLLLIYVINKQSFGWTIQFHWPVAILLAALSAIYLATILAGLYPARVAVRLVPIEVIHEE